MFSRWCEGKESRGKELRGTQQIPFPNIGSDLEHRERFGATGFDQADRWFVVAFFL